MGYELPGINYLICQKKIRTKWKKRYSSKLKNFPFPSLQIPIQYRTEGAAVGAWVFLDPKKEEQTGSAVGGGG